MADAVGEEDYYVEEPLAEVEAVGDKAEKAVAELFPKADEVSYLAHLRDFC